MEKEKPIFDLKSILLIIGLILILFSSVVFFTKPALWDFYDFSDTGQIGDTIGGITTPILSLIGSVLIFISFKAQINANKIQYKLLNKEIETQKHNRNFQIGIELLKGLKEDFRNLNYRKFYSQSSINAYVNEIKQDWTKDIFKKHLRRPIYQDWKFIMVEYNLIIHHIINSEFQLDERNKLFLLVYNYYNTQLKYPTNIIKKQLGKHGYKSNKTLDIIDVFTKLQDNFSQKI